jgi:hypothetical protein
MQREYVHREGYDWATDALITVNRHGIMLTGAGQHKKKFGGAEELAGGQE